MIARGLVEKRQEPDGTVAYRMTDNGKLLEGPPPAMTESYIANLCRFRADLLRRFALRQYESTSEALREILNEIDEELTDAS